MFKIHTASEWFEEHTSGYVLVSDRWLLEIGLSNKYSFGSTAYRCDYDDSKKIVVVLDLGKINIGLTER